MNKTQQKVPKPWFKKWWVWALVVFGLIMAGGALSGGENDSASNKSKAALATDSQLKDNYHVGQVVNHKGYKFKVNGVTYYDGSKLDNPKSGNRYVICNVTIKNDTDKKQRYTAMDFTLNENGNSNDMTEVLTSEKHAHDILESGNLDSGASVTGNLIGQAKRDANLTLHYQPSIWNDETVKVALY